MGPGPALSTDGKVAARRGVEWVLGQIWVSGPFLAQAACSEALLKGPQVGGWLGPPEVLAQVLGVGVSCLWGSVCGGGGAGP